MRTVEEYSEAEDIAGNNHERTSPTGEATCNKKQVLLLDDSQRLYL
jgi:hypothetical protein